jgi:hypothetical protein
MPSIYTIELGFDLEPSISKFLECDFFCGIEPFFSKTVIAFVLQPSSTLDFQVLHYFLFWHRLTKLRVVTQHLLWLWIQENQKKPGSVCSFGHQCGCSNRK